MTITATDLGSFAGNTGSATVTTLANIAAGNLVICMETDDSGSTGVNGTLGSSDNWANGALFFTPTNFGSLLYKFNATALASGGSFNVSMPLGAARNTALAGVVFSGPEIISASDPFASQNTANGTSTAPSSGNLSVGASQCLLVGCVALVGTSADTFTEAAGWTQIKRVGIAGVNGPTINVAWKLGSGTQAYAPTLGTSRGWGAIIIQFTIGSSLKQGLIVRNQAIKRARFY